VHELEVNGNYVFGPNADSFVATAKPNYQAINHSNIATSYYYYYNYYYYYIPKLRRESPFRELDYLT
jgi:hypothetical protein